MIFLSVLILGTRKGALAGGIGAALSDLLGGYMHWVIPTFIIKYIMATVMGLFIDKIMPNRKGNWLIGSIVGGIVHRQCTGADFADNYRRCSGNSSGGIVQ